MSNRSRPGTAARQRTPPPPRAQSPRPMVSSGGLATRPTTPLRAQRHEPFDKDDATWTEVLEDFTHRVGPRGAVVQNVWLDAQDTFARMYVGQIKELRAMLNDHHKPFDAKLDSILHKMRNIEGDSGLQVDCANLDLSPVVNEVTKLGKQLNDTVHEMEASSGVDVASLERRVTQKIEEIGAITHEMQGIQSETVRQVSDLAASVGELGQRMEKPVLVDFSPVLGKVSRSCQCLQDDFVVVGSHLANIQRAMHLDFMPFQRTATSRGRSDQDRSLPSRGNSLPAPQGKPLLTLVPEDETKENMPEEQEEAKEEEEPAAGSLSYQWRFAVPMREIWAQTEQEPTSERSAQTDSVARQEPPKTEKILSPAAKDRKGSMESSKTRHLFEQAALLKAKARASLFKPKYNVHDYYYKEGVCQAIVKSPWFEFATLCVVCLNALWISVDIDNNTAALIIHAHPVFQVVDNLFCIYFFLEISVRFGAFASKWRCLKDLWFVFDTLLVSNLIGETWLIPLLVAALGMDVRDLVDLTMLRAVRLVKLLRLTRMVKFLRAVPELVVIVKALVLGARSMAVFFFLWLVIIYIFAVVFRQVTAGEAIGQVYFQSVPASMSTLLMDGILADYSSLMHDLSNTNLLLFLLILIFIMLASVTIMYMFLGTLVDAVSTIIKGEQEELTISYVASQLRKTMKEFAYDLAEPLAKEALEELLVEPEIIRVLQSVSVDVIALLDSLDVLYEDVKLKGEQMTFEQIVDIVLDMRGSNGATVKDSKDQVRVLKSMLQTALNSLTEHFELKITSLLEEVQNISNKTAMWQHDSLQLPWYESEREPDSP